MQICQERSLKMVAVTDQANNSVGNPRAHDIPSLTLPTDGVLVPIYHRKAPDRGCGAGPLGNFTPLQTWPRVRH